MLDNGNLGVKVQPVEYQPLYQMDTLNLREQNILELIGEGLTNEQIAQNLNLSLNTVKWYVKNIFNKLNVKNRTQAANLFRKQGKTANPTPIENQLPHILSDFVGRANELQALTTQLTTDQERLITILGIGGVGKTRLAVEVARRFSAQVYFISLAGLQSPSHVFREIAIKLGINQNEPETFAALVSYLRQRRMLLVLDNLDDLTELGGQLVYLLEQAPHLKMLITSRAALNVRGERIFPLFGLSTEKNTGEAGELFKRMVQKSHPKFQFTAADYQEIWAITQLTEGLPLAIELASSWVGILPLAKIRQQLQTNLDLLISESPDLPDRHRSLQAVLNYTWEALSLPQKKILQGLAIFEAGFTYESAEALTKASPMVFRQLVHKALIQPVDMYHFRLHALIRQFILSQLTPIQVAELKHQHALYYLNWLQPEVRRLNSQFATQHFSLLLAEQVNLFQAWQTFLETQDIPMLLQMVDLGYWMDMAGWWQEGLELVQLTLAQIQDPIVQGRLFFVHTLLSFRLNDLPSIIRYGEAAVPLLVNTPYQVEAAVALGMTAIFETLFSSVEVALGKIQTGYQLLSPEILAERPLIRWVIRSFEGSIYMLSRDTKAAMEHFSAILAAVPDTADWLINILYVNLGEGYLIVGDTATARQYLTIGYRKGVTSKDPMVALGAAYYLTHLDNPDAFETKLNEILGFLVSPLLISRLATYLGTFALIRQQIEFAIGFFGVSLYVLYRAEDDESLQKQAQQVINLLPQSPFTEQIRLLLNTSFSEWEPFFNALPFIQKLG